MTDLTDVTQYDLKPGGSDPNSLKSVAADQALKGFDWQSSFGGRFEPLSLLGRGGFAIVYRVFDRKLQREVALKILHSSLSGDDQARKWLKREGLATASLNHPHIVALHDFEATDRACYLVTELINGKTLTQFTQEHPDGCDPRIAAEIVLCLAEALAHAHAKNVLHRDIKPSNILLDFSRPTGTLPFSPRLADFGLATAPTLESLSHSAASLMGTVHYLPPEIVNGSPSGFTAQGDIYALATVLRELLTGQRAVSATTYSQIITQISHGEFDSLVAKRTRLPADVIAICSQGMEVTPSRRYATASLLAQDLRSFLNGHAVSARIPGFLERSRRAIRRHPVVAATLGLASVAVLSITALVLAHDYRVAKLNTELYNRNELLETALSASQAARFQNEQIIYSQDMAQASENLQSGNLRGARATLNRYAEDQPLHTHRDADWFLLNRRVERNKPHNFWQAPHALYVGCFTKNGRILFAGGAGDQISILQMASGKVKLQYTTGQLEINCLQLNSDESVLWSTGDDGTVCAWELKKDELLWRSQAFDASTEAYDLVHLDQVDRLVVLGSSDELRVLSATDGKLETGLVLPDGKHTAIGDTWDGRHFLVADDQERLFLVDGTSMQVVRELPLTTSTHARVPGFSMRAIDVSPDGRWATAITLRNVVYLVDLLQWTVSDSISIPESPRNICFLDALDAAIASDDQRFWLITRPGVFFDFEITPEGKLLERNRWTSAGERVFSVARRPQTQEIFTFGGEGNLQQWSGDRYDWQIDSNALHKAWFSQLLVDCGRWLDLPFNQTRQLLFLQSNRRSIDFYSQSHQPGNLYIRAKSASLCDVGPSGLWVVEQPDVARSVPWKDLIEHFHQARPGTKPSQIEIAWQERPLPYRADELGDSSQYFRLVASNDGQWTAGWDQESNYVWCMPPDQPELVKKTAAQEVTLVWFEPTSQVLWWVAQHRALHSWNLADGSSPQLVTTLPNLPVKDLAMSPDNRHLAIMCDNESCYLWDLKESKMAGELMHDEALKDVAFSHSGKTLVVLGERGRITCWNIASGRKTFDQSYSDAPVYGGFSADSRFLIRSSDHYNRWRIEPLGDNQF